MPTPCVGTTSGPTSSPGATSGELDEVEAALGVVLPASYRELYGWSAGVIDEFGTAPSYALPRRVAPPARAGRRGAGPVAGGLRLVRVRRRPGRGAVRVLRGGRSSWLPAGRSG